MTEIKAGTRVTALDVDGTEEITGVLLERGQPYENIGERSVLPDGNDPYAYRYVLPETIKAVNPFAFIGPKPEPVEEPRVVLPFTVDPGCKSIITDANGRDVLTVNGMALVEAEEDALAAFVVRLLNEYWGVG